MLNIDEFLFNYLINFGTATDWINFNMNNQHEEKLTLKVGGRI